MLPKKPVFFTLHLIFALWLVHLMVQVGIIIPRHWPNAEMVSLGAGILILEAVFVYFNAVFAYGAWVGKPVVEV